MIRKETPGPIDAETLRSSFNDDELEDLILEVDSEVNDANWTLSLIANLEDTVKSKEYEIWCDGTALSLQCLHDDASTVLIKGPEITRDFGLAHSFESIDEDWAVKTYEDVKTGWALRFGCSPAPEKLWDSPAEPSNGEAPPA